ncbi:MAG: FixH family protein [Verrucomicrobia bacterium]|nr:FixH family protein [Verrucomicrobiota bacterium]
MNTTDHSTAPLRNLWPHAIIATFVIFICGTAALIAIACTHQTDLITPNYYEDEIKFQSRLDQLNRTAPLSNQVVVAYDAAKQSISISLPAGQTSSVTSGRIELYRPSATDRDRELKLQIDASGSQTVDAASLLPGFWKVRVHWTTQGQDYFADKSIVVKRGA